MSYFWPADLGSSRSFNDQLNGLEANKSIGSWIFFFLKPSISESIFNQQARSSLRLSLQWLLLDRLAIREQLSQQQVLATAFVRRMAVRSMAV